MIFNTYVIFDHQLFAVLWRSLKAYISTINLQHWLMTSGGQSRSTIYFSFSTSSKLGKDGERKTILSLERLRCLSYTGHFKTKCKTDSGSLEHSGQAGAIVLLIRHVDKTFMSILNRVKIFLIQGFLILYLYDLWRSSSMKYFNVSNLLEESNLLLRPCLNWSSKRVLNNLWKEELAMKGLSQTSPTPWVFNKAWMHCTQLCFSWIAVLYASFTSLFCVPVVIRNQYLIAMDQALWVIGNLSSSS